MLEMPEAMSSGIHFAAKENSNYSKYVPKRIKIQYNVLITYIVVVCNFLHAKLSKQITFTNIINIVDYCACIIIPKFKYH